MNYRRELLGMLNLVAKAAGYWSNEFNCADKLPHLGWDPIGDDGDSRRLQIAIGIDLLIDGGTVTACFDKEDLSIKVVERYLPDPCAAARLATVKVAAEIGRNMK